MTEDGRFLVAEVSRGCDPYNMLFYYDVQAVDNKITGKLELKTIFDKLDAKYEVSKKHLTSHHLKAGRPFVLR